MDLARRCAYISNSYYNKGLRLTLEYDLTGAAESLKKSLQFNKRNTDARNLLGLIYYHIGEASDALVQWVLSLNLQPVNNDADRYLNEVQRQSGLLDSYGQSILKFNQALTLAQAGSDDLAILQLSKICDTRKTYLRAHLLLGLLLMETNEYAKSYKCFQKAIKIDRGNPLAIRCLNELRSYQKSAKDSKKSLKKSFKTDNDSGGHESNPDIIIPEPYNEHQGLKTAGNVIIGLLIGIASVVFIYLPVKEAAISREYNKQVINVSQQLSDANKQITQNEIEKQEIQSRLDKSNDEMNIINAVNDNKRLALQNLMAAVRQFDAGNIDEAAKNYANINKELIIDVVNEDETTAAFSPEAAYNELSEYFNNDGYVTLTHKGDQKYEEEDYQGAMDYYDLSIAVHPSNPVALYKKGLCYFMMGDRKKANELFDEVVKKYPDHETAEMAKRERGY